MYRRYNKRNISAINKFNLLRTVFCVAMACLIIIVSLRLDCSDTAGEQQQRQIEKPLPTERIEPQANTAESVEYEDTTEIDIVEPELTMYFDSDDVTTMAKVLYRECRGVTSKTRQACVVWTACNRVDAGYAWTITEVLTAPSQFAWEYNTPVWDELYDLAEDVLTRWNNEKNGIEDVGRVLPSYYLWFGGDGKENHFRSWYSGGSGYWDYSLQSPYET